MTFEAPRYVSALVGSNRAQASRPASAQVKALALVTSSGHAQLTTRMCWGPGPRPGRRLPGRNPLVSVQHLSNPSPAHIGRGSAVWPAGGVGRPIYTPVHTSVHNVGSRFLHSWGFLR